LISDKIRRRLRLAPVTAELRAAAALGTGNPGRGATRIFSTIAEGGTIRDGIKAGVASYGERGPIASALDARKIAQMKADVMPVLRNDPVRRVIFKEIDAANLDPAYAKRLKNDLDTAAAQHADALASQVKGGSLKNRRAVHAPAYFHDMHSTAAKLHCAILDFVRHLLEGGDQHLRSFLDPKNVARGHALNPATRPAPAAPARRSSCRPTTSCSPRG
jgi:hypothetical protein